MEFKAGDTAYISLKDISKMPRYQPRDSDYIGRKLTIKNMDASADGLCELSDNYVIPIAFLRKTKPPMGKPVDLYALLENKGGQF